MKIVQTYCKRGHPYTGEIRKDGRGSEYQVCRVCVNLKQRELRKARPRDPEKLQHYRAQRRVYGKTWRDKLKLEQPLYYRDRWLRRRYGISFADIQRMLTDQKFRCAICETNIDEINRAVDHCHQTGKVRGLLCVKCNMHLGIIENAQWLAAAQKYLKKYKELRLRQRRSLLIAGADV